MKVLESHEEMEMAALFGRGTGDGALRADQIGRLVGRPAVRTVVAVLVGCLAARTTPKNETIGQEDSRLGIVELSDLPLFDVATRPERRPDLTHQGLVGRRVGAPEMIVDDAKGVQVGDVRGPHLVEQRLRGAALALGPQHGRRPVRVVAAEITDLVSAQALEPQPEIRLQRLDQIAEMDPRIHVGQRARDQDLSGLHRSPRW